MTDGKHTAFPTVEEAIQSIRNAADIVNSRLINREEVVEQAFFALLTGEHLLLQSRTGVGKTLLADQIFSTFEGARIFRVQASKEQQPDTYFGGLDIEKLKTGQIFHNTEGSLVESEFGFIDEIFDANDFTLRALLSLLNERALVRGVQYQRSEIHSVIAATNYLRISEVTEAVLDRFLYKAVILPDKNPFVQYRIAQQYLVHSGATMAVQTRMQFSTLRFLNDIVAGRHPSHSIAIAPDVLYFSNLVIRHYEYMRNRSIRENTRSQSGAVQDFYISPRTQAKSLDLLRAIALMNGRTTVAMEDVGKLYMIFTTLGMDDERQMFAKSYTTLVNTLSVSNGFDQLKVLLGFASLVDDLKRDPALLERPLSELQTSPIRRTVIEWVKDVFSGGGDQTVENNKKVLASFLREFIPVSDEIRELKQNLEAEVQKLMRI